MLPKYLIKRPRIPKTTIPHLIDRLHRLQITLTPRPTPNRLDRPPPHTILMMIRKVDDAVAEEFVRPPTFATQGTGSDLVKSTQRVHISVSKTRTPPASSRIDACRKLMGKKNSSPRYKPRPSTRTRPPSPPNPPSTSSDPTHAPSHAPTYPPPAPSHLTH